MAEKTATESTPQPNPYCADGCGNRVGSAKSTFLQGHDQRLISDLSFRVVDGEMGTFQRALLGLTENISTTAADEFYYAENGDIMDRINAISAAMALRFSSPLADKFTSAAMAKWDKVVKQTAAQAAREQAKAKREAEGKKPRVRKPKAAAAESPATPEQEPASTVGQEIQNLRGSTVKVKIGRWTYDATVVGMNQAGKITAVEYTDKKGVEKTTDRFTLVK